MTVQLTRCRLERAKKLLRETNLPAYRVAEAAGFGGIQPMMRLFRKETGITAIEYREKENIAPKQSNIYM